MMCSKVGCLPGGGGGGGGGGSAATLTELSCETRTVTNRVRGHCAKDHRPHFRRILEEEEAAAEFVESAPRSVEGRRGGGGVLKKEGC